MDYFVDVKGKKLGRVASEIAVILQGKKNPNYEPRLEGEDRVIIKNINGLQVSGEKISKKIYYRHTTQLGHLKKNSLKEVWDKRGAGEVLRLAVKRMLPQNRLNAKRLKRLIIEN